MKTEYWELTGVCAAAQMKRERSANLRQDRCCEVESQTNATGEGWEGACGVEAESEDLPDKCVSDSSD